MIPLPFLRDHPDAVRRSLDLRGADAPLDQTLALDAQRRALLLQVEQLKADRNKASKAIGATKDPAERDRLIADQRGLGDRIDTLDDQLRTLDSQLRDLLALFPNLVDPSVPPGKDETDNVVLRQVGEPKTFSFTPKPHWEIGEALGLLDVERAAAMAGARMYLLKGFGARLQRALIGYFLDKHADAGYTEFYLPAMVRGEVMFASGQLPKFRDNLYHDADEDYWFIPTAEVPLTALHRNEILNDSQLPLRYAAHTPCFRREKASAGRDVRGMKRVHQFEKVEIYQFTTPEQSADTHREMIAHVESILHELGLIYRVVQLCSADLGFSAAISYDLEVWCPGLNEWMEVSSLSNCTDFQAHRANIRYRPAGGKPRPVHTLNGSGLPTGRIIAALLEHYQQPDGSVLIPHILHSRLGVERITPA